MKSMIANAGLNVDEGAEKPALESIKPPVIRDEYSRHKSVRLGPYFPPFLKMDSTSSSHSVPDRTTKLAQASRMEDLQGDCLDTSTCSSLCSADSCGGNSCLELGCDHCTLQSVQDTEACSLDACLIPNECDSVECCREEACIHPSDIALRSPSLTGDATDYYQDEFDDFINYANEPNESIHCQWLETDHQCPVSAPPAALSQHVFEAHIEQHTLLPCGWDQCDQTVESQGLVEHVSQQHHHDEYVCLWQGCGYTFSSDEELAAHMTTMHTTKLDCHWGGCEFIHMDPVALKSHVNDEHLNMNPSEAFRHQVYNSSLSAPSSSASRPYTPQLHELSSHCTSPSPYEFDKGISQQTIDLVQAPKGHTCLWMMDATTLCGATLAHENDLQAHVEQEHTGDLSARGHSLGNSVFICNWQGCKAEGTPYNGKDKLRKHTWIHTRCYFFECSFCSQKFNSKAPYENHLRTHTREKPFKCDRCPSAFPNREALTTHLRTHTGEKHLTCEVCGFECADSSNLSKHRKIHKPPVHTCSICKKAFCRADSLKRHMIQHQKTAGEKRGQ